MSATNSTFPIQVLEYNPVVFEYLCETMAVGSVGQVAFVVYFVLVHDQQVNPKVITPFNICLVIYGFSMGATYTLEAAIFDRASSQYGSVLSIELEILYTVQTFTINAALFSYDAYSWLRAGKIAKAVINPLGVVLLQILVYGLIPVFYFAGSISILVGTFYPSANLSVAVTYIGIIGFILTDVLDACLVLIFLLHVRKYSLEGFTADPQFALITKFGIASCISMTAGTTCYILYRQSYFEPYFFGFFAFLSLTFTILIIMKVGLHKLKMSEAASRTLSRRSHK